MNLGGLAGKAEGTTESAVRTALAVKSVRVPSIGTPTRPHFSYRSDDRPPEPDTASDTF
jgi:hypothetical protein